MKKINLAFFVFVILIGLTFCFDINFNHIITFNNEYKTGSESIILPGTYKSSDGHTLVIASDKSVTYDSTYSLTISADENTITGKIGTNNKAVTLYRISESTFVNSAVVSYTHSGSTVSLYEYTIFVLEGYTFESDANGVIEVWRDGSKVNSFSNLQDAVSFANAGDTIEITENISIENGAYIDKDLVIDGNGFTIDRSGFVNSVFVIGEDADVTIKDLTIDGGANEFIVDFSIAYPAVKEGTLDNDPKLNISAIVSKGNLNASKLNVNNNYTLSSGSAISIVLGSATFDECEFNHNYGNAYGGAIYIAGSFKTGQTTQPIKNVEFKNCDLSYNYTLKGNGGALFAYNLETLKFTNCDFSKNMSSTYSAGGGAVYISRNGVKLAESNNLEYTQAYFTDCDFVENYSGNDGYAIQNESAELYIEGCNFIGNVGLSSGSSVGTVSCMLDGNRIYDVVITNSTFEKNVMGASVFGDHGTLVNLKMENVSCKENDGNMSILLYSANAVFNNVTFENESVLSTVLDVRPYVSETTYPLYKPQTITLNNVDFVDTAGPTDVLVRRRNHNMSYNTATVVIEGENNANVDLWDDTNLIVKGTLNGDVSSDGVTPEDNIVFEDGSLLNGEYDSYFGSYTITLTYSVDPTNTSTLNKFLYLSAGTYTDIDLFNFHRLSDPNNKLVYYTDSAFTTLWDYNVSGNMTLYAKWEEHSHVRTNNLVLFDNVIYDQCECGYLGNKLALEIPSDLYYNGNEKGASIINELGIDSSLLNITYQKRTENGVYEEIDFIPKEVGSYRANLIYDNMLIFADYEVLEFIENPSTSDNGLLFAISSMLSFVVLLLLVIYIKVDSRKTLT